MPSLRALTVIAVVASAGCSQSGLHHQPRALVDLACDQLISEPTRDSTRTTLTRGQVLPESAGTGRGALRIHFLAYRDGETLDPPFRVRVYRERGVLAQTVQSDSMSALVSGAAGPALLEFSCIRCTRPTVSVEIPAGRVDTLRVYLTRLRDSCERARARQTDKTWQLFWPDSALRAAQMYLVAEL